MEVDFTVPAGADITVISYSNTQTFAKTKEEAMNSCSVSGVGIRLRKMNPISNGLRMTKQLTSADSARVQSKELRA